MIICHELAVMSKVLLCLFDILKYKKNNITSYKGFSNLKASWFIRTHEKESYWNRQV